MCEGSPRGLDSPTISVCVLRAKKEWKAAADDEIGALMRSAEPKIGFGLETNKDPEIRKLKKEKALIKRKMTWVNKRS